MNKPLFLLLLTIPVFTVIRTDHQTVPAIPTLIRESYTHKSLAGIASSRWLCTPGKPIGKCEGT